MKAKFNIVFLSLLAIILSGCIEEHIPSEPETVKEERIKVKFNLLIPLHNLPSTRAIANDSKIDDYTVWVFDNDTLVEAVVPSDTYTDEDGKVKNKITYDLTNGGNMYIALDPALTSVRLMMVANCSVNAPVVGTPWTDAEDTLRKQKFTYTGLEDVNYMPMYGISGAPFAVKQGAEGVIQLKRCMAKVVVDVSEAKDHFKLESIYVFHAADTGTVAPKNPITNLDSFAENIKIPGQVKDTTVGTVYIPEIAGIADGDIATITSVVIKGKYKPIEGGEPKTKYYRFNFIERVEDVEGISYKIIDTIQRNFLYKFEVQYLIEDVGKDNLEDVLKGDAANYISKDMSVIKIDDEGILDITTDNYTYLGVTALKITAVDIIDYYAANIDVVTNHPDGWEIKGLKDGVIALPRSWVPDSASSSVEVQSVWIFFPKSSYDPGQQVTIYIYSGNIRKAIEITMPT